MRLTWSKAHRVHFLHRSLPDIGHDARISMFTRTADTFGKLEDSICDLTRNVLKQAGLQRCYEFDLGNAIDQDDGIWFTVPRDGLTAWIRKELI